jgi:hypothetical protein
MPKQLNEFAPDQPELGQAAPVQDGGHDHEGAMAKADLYKLSNYSLKLFKQINDDQQLEAWVQAKITKAADYIASVYHYLEYEMKFSEYGSKLENSDVYSESEKKELLNKLQEAKQMLRALKLQQVDRLDEGKKSKKADKDYDGDGKVESGKDEYLGSKIRAAKKAGKIEEGAGDEATRAALAKYEAEYKTATGYDKVNLARTISALRKKLEGDTAQPAPVAGTVNETMGGEPCPCEACGGTGQVMSPAKSWSPEAKAKAAKYNKKAKAYAAAAKRIDANKNGIPDDEEAAVEEAPKKKSVSKKEETPAEESQGSSKHSFGQGIYENEEVEGAKKAKDHNKEQDTDIDSHDDDIEEGRDEGKPGKNFAKIAKKAGKKYGSKEAGERVAGAVRAKLAKQGKLEEGVLDAVSNFAGDMFNTDASLERRSPQLQQLLAMRKKYPDGTPEARQLDARIKLLKDRLSIDGSEVMGQGGMPKPVVDPATFSKQNPNFKVDESLNESAELARMKEFLTRLNG